MRSIDTLFQVKDNTALFVVSLLITIALILNSLISKADDDCSVSATWSATEVSCYGESDGAIDITVSGSYDSYSVSWTGPNGFSSFTNDISGLEAGTYDLDITAYEDDDDECYYSASITINEPSAITISTISKTDNACFSENTGSIDIDVDGGETPYSYSWSNGATTEDVNNLYAGGYSVTVSDNNNCSDATASYTITEPAELISSVSLSAYNGGVNISCNGAMDGWIDLSVSGGTTPYAYNWNTSDAAEDLDSLPAGNYSVVVSDANSCSVMESVTLTEPQGFSLGLSTSAYSGGYQVSCNGNNDGSIDLSISGGTSPYAYNWNNGSSTQDISGLQEGYYAVSITDGNDCFIGTGVTLNAPDSLTITYTASSYNGYNISCYGYNDGFIDAQISGGTSSYNYSWEGPSGFTADSGYIENLYAGSYYLTVTDENGCSETGSIVLTEPDSIHASLSTSVYASGSNVSCYYADDGYIECEITGGYGGYDVAWDGPDSYYSEDEDINNLYAGNYTVTIEDGNGCTYSKSIYLEEPENPVTGNIATSSYVGKTNVSCEGASDGWITASGEGGSSSYTISWQGPNGFSANGDSIGNLQAGPYYVTVSDENGCNYSKAIILNEPEALTVSGDHEDVTCYGGDDGNINLVVSGGNPQYSYEWSGPGNYNGKTESVNGLSAGTYAVTITDINGCTATYTETLAQPEELRYSSYATPEYCARENARINLETSGGISPYSYSWTGDGYTSNEQNPENISSGTYTVTITDDNGCTAKKEVKVGMEPAYSISGRTEPVACSGGENGSIEINIYGGYSPFAYRWSNGVKTKNNTGLDNGSYSLTVTDSEGCEQIKQYYIDENNPVEANIYSPVLSGDKFNITKPGASDGSIDLTPSGGTAPYQYSWSTGETTEDIEGLKEGRYSVEIIDASGCKTTAFIELVAPELLDLPTGFSPNSDGRNDFFIVKGIEAFPENKLVIFNRWGNEVFTTKKYENDWDGTNNRGEALPDGTYFVVVVMTGGQGVIEKKGFVDLRR